MLALIGGVQIAVTFVWLGMVLAISFLEAPLKFRSPGITVPLGVGIGRLVFRALNAVEGAFAVVLVVGVFAGSPAVSAATIWLVVALCADLAIGALLLRPLMDRRVKVGRAAHGLPRNSLHVWYILLEGVKVILLLVLGVAYVGR